AAHRRQRDDGVPVELGAESMAVDGRAGHTAAGGSNGDSDRRASRRTWRERGGAVGGNEGVAGPVKTITAPAESSPPRSRRTPSRLPPPRGRCRARRRRPLPPPLPRPHG